MNALIVFAVMLAPPPHYESVAVDDITVLLIQMKKSLTVKQAESLSNAVVDAGGRYDIDPLFLLAVGYTESRWSMKMRSGDKGKSHGIFQMTLGVARTVDFGGIFEDEVAKKSVYRSKKKQIKLLKDIWVSSQTVAAYFARLRKKYGSWADVVYNCGPIRCGKKNGRRMKSTPATRGYWRNYKKIKNNLSELVSVCGESEGSPNGL